MTVTKTGAGSGTVTSSAAGISCGSACSQDIVFGTTVAFTASPGPNSRFNGWSGACSGTGACQPTVAGSDVTVGAAFQLASFGSSTSIALSPVSTKISAGGALTIKVKNDNDFSITGALSGQTAGKVVVSRRRKVKLKSKPIQVAAKSSQTISLKLGRQLQRILARKHKLKLVLTADVKDPAGNSRKVSKTVSLRLKQAKRRRQSRRRRASGK